MKIGVITMHKVRNFGSALQAYALQTALEKMGHEVKIIDYKYPNATHRSVKKISFKSSLKNLLNDLGLLKFVNPEVMHFAKFYKLFKLTRKYNSPQKLKRHVPRFDVYVTGSDQVWNPRHTKGDTSFLLDFAPSKSRKIAYAASFATKTLDRKTAEKFTPLLKEYHAASVREQNGKELYEKLTGKSVSVALDPSLLLNRDEWEMVVQNKKNPWAGKDYILVYFLSYAYNPFPYAFEVAKYVSKKLNKKLICLCLESNVADYKKNLPYAELVQKVGPIQFIQLFLNASFVVTTSFHGTAFSANFNKPMLSIVNPNSDDDRQLSFLKNIDRSSAIVKYGESLEKLPIQQSFAIQNLDDLRRKSYFFLEEALR